MNFLFFNTVFLAGLAALAIPVILHFFFRGRRRKLRFSTLRFFVQEDPQQVNRRKLRQLLLMALRMLLIALIVLAFARPYMNESEAGAQAETSNTVILIDVTASMRGGLENGAWDRGLKELRDWVSVFPVGHKVALVACGSSSEVLVHWGLQA